MFSGLYIRFHFPMCCTLSALIFALKTRRTTSDLLLENLHCSGIYGLQVLYFPPPFRRCKLPSNNLYLHGCRYACPIKCVDAKDVVLAEDNETVLEIRVEYDPEKKTKPKVCNLSPLLELKMCFEMHAPATYSFLNSSVYVFHRGCCIGSPNLLQGSIHSKWKFDCLTDYLTQRLAIIYFLRPLPPSIIFSFPNKNCACARILLSLRTGFLI